MFIFEELILRPCYRVPEYLRSERFRANRSLREKDQLFSLCEMDCWTEVICLYNRQVFVVSLVD
jgi:hypothetical protein